MKKLNWTEKFEIWLKNQGYNLNSFCKAKGLHQPTVWRIVNGKVNATARMAKLIEAATDGEIRASEILGLY